MAATTASGAALAERLAGCHVLMVGAGGIGCELLKNLVLTGCTRVDIIDLDTIDVSNLNRQFLFRREHVGKSKAQVAREGALLFNPDVTIVAYHDSIMNAEYGVQFFKKFDVVLNALDNRAARNHVNRMCLAADVPLIESGTAGYLGQVNVIKKGLTECYECFPKPAQKSFPGCTIRNTPSEPIHCIVWAKHLFNQLYGEADPDQDVSPDTQDPEAAGDAGQQALDAAASTSEDVGTRKSTRVWVDEISYNPTKLFNKFFRDDIKYLLSMENLWKKRRPPTPLDYNDLSATADAVTPVGVDGLIRDQRVWTIRECIDVFAKSVGELKDELAKGGEGATLVWDKDSEAAMNFVASASNVRSHIFNIPIKSKFDIKSMAGNIIPAIATTNAIIAGVIVMEAVKVLMGRMADCKSVYLNRQPNDRKKLIIPVALDKPNAKCYVCSARPEVSVHLNVNTCSVKTLEDKVMKGCLGMVAPDVEIDDGKGTILISSEEGETEDNWSKSLAEFGLATGSRLKCDDFLQEYNLIVNIVHKDKLAEDQEFELVGDVSAAALQADQSAGASGDAANGAVAAAASTSKEESDDDDLIVMDDEEEEQEEVAAAKDAANKRLSGKRKAASHNDVPSKKSRTEPTDDTCAVDDDDDDVLLID